MAGAQAGDDSGYRALLSEVAEAVRRYLRVRLGACDFIEDCVQEVLMAVHQARHTYDPRRPFRPGLFAIVRHKTLDSLRRGRARPTAAPGEDPAWSPNASGPDADIAVGQLLAGLPEGLREALVLTKIVGLSVAEAARELSISESATKVRVHRAMGKLKRQLELESA